MIRALILTLSVASGLAPIDLTAQSRKQSKARPTIELATLGMTTSAPSAKQAKALGLKFEVRVRGQLVTELVRGGPASKAGVRKGDVLERIDDNEIYSKDDIADFLAVSKPKQKIELHVVRGKSKKQKVLKATLTGKRVKASKTPRLTWQFASLGQLDTAIAKAKKEQRLLLIGLSGAET